MESFWAFAADSFFTIQALKGRQKPVIYVYPVLNLQFLFQTDRFILHEEIRIKGG